MALPATTGFLNSNASSAAMAPAPKDCRQTVRFFTGRECQVLSGGLAAYLAEEKAGSASHRAAFERPKRVAMAIIKSIALILAAILAIPFYPFAELYSLIRYRRLMSARLIEKALLPSVNRSLQDQGWKALGDKVKPIELSSAEGSSLQAYHLKLTDEPAKHLVVVFNPNGESCEGAWPRTVINHMAHFQERKGLEFLFFDYEGVGRSKGHTYHLQAIEQASARAMEWAKEWLKSHPGLTESNLMLSGYSLGGGAAALMAQNYPQAQLYLTHTFKDWSQAVRGLVNRFLPRWVGAIAGLFARVLGGHHFSPEKALLAREANAAARKLLLGNVYIIASSKDRWIAPEAALMVPKTCYEGVYQGSYTLRLEKTRHCHVTEFPEEFV